MAVAARISRQCRRQQWRVREDDYFLKCCDRQVQLAVGDRGRNPHRSKEPEGLQLCLVVFALTKITRFDM